MIISKHAKFKLSSITTSTVCESRITYMASNNVQ